MLPVFSSDFCRQFVVLLSFCTASAAAQIQAAVQLPKALQALSTADTRSMPQEKIQQAWQAVATSATAEQIPQILTAMKDAGPLSDNWLRSVVDAIAERELRETGKLPANALEAFVQDTKNSPRGRRVAYEWLVKVDEAVPERMLPQMLDDPSLELRYDAVAKLLDSAKVVDDESDKLAVYQRALRSARDIEQLRSCAEALKELGQEPNMAEALGYLTSWKVIGPFDNTDRAGFNKIHFRTESIDLEGEYEGKSGPVKWKAATAEQEDLEDLGKVDLNAALVEEKSVLAYAFTTFFSATDQDVECRYESKEATKLWVNGKEVAVSNVYHSGGGFDQHVVPCKLKSGENQIVIKVCQNEQTQPWTKPWDFRLRVTGKLGGAIKQSK